MKLPTTRHLGAIALLVATSVVAGGVPASQGAGDDPAAVPDTHGQIALRDHMRKLWEEHVTWTRLAIVSFDADLPDLPASEQRLLQNQADIGNAIAPYYGRAAADRLTTLLREHILEAVAVLQAAKDADASALQQALERWYANADQIARFLHHANPENWALLDLKLMMHRHLKLTTNEAVAHLQGDYQADVQAYDEIENEILQMADMLSAGIIDQFPDRFR
jgi:hypothetical protein